MPHTYLTTNVYCRRLFGSKVYKLALSAATGCPNRDGTLGAGGCVFCSAGGSGDFAASAVLPVSHQIEEARRILGTKGEGLKYIAYFQSYTGTYGDLVRLERVYTEAANHPDILFSYRRRYPYLCVDEAQDTSKIQHMIIRLLVGEGGNLFMVGDEDQSIYGFRAAYPDALIDRVIVYPDNHLEVLWKLKDFCK